jgi:hypothetical protein
MEEFKAIEFQKTRDFGQKINATFEFIRQNFKPLAKSILMIAGPSVFAGGLIAGSFMSKFFTLGFLTQPNPVAYSNYFLSFGFWAQLVMAFIFFTVSFVFAIATINCYLTIYDKKKSNNIEFGEVWNEVRNVFLPYLGSSILFFILFIVAYVVILIPIIAIGRGSGALVFFGILILFIVLFYLLFSSSLTYFIQLYEQKNFFSALTRSFQLVNGKWWSTFGLIFVLYLVMMVAMYIISIPYYAVIITKTLHNVSNQVAPEPSSGMMMMTLAFFTIYYMVQIVLYSLPNIGIAFQYFNLVELKEAKGLMSKIENLGEEKTPASNRPEEHY